jgi:hypothetical protein
MTTMRYDPVDKALEKLDAWGAIEDRDADKVREGHKMYDAFRAGRDLKRVIPGKEFLPWLFRARFYSKFWRENYDIKPPFYDHVRYFTNGKERIATIQPYLLAVALEESTHTREHDFDCEPLKLSKEFQAIYYDCVNSRPQYTPLPDTSIVKEAIDAILQKARKVSEEFAHKHGLCVQVSFNGWYNPQETILIEYRRKEAA